MIPEYRATAHYDGTWWTVTFDNLPPGYDGATQGRTWAEVRHNAREYLALVTQTRTYDFSLVMRPDDADAAALIVKLEAAEHALYEAKQAKTDALGAAARGLAAKYTLPDAGAMLGLPYQHIVELAGKEGEQ